MTLTTCSRIWTATGDIAVTDHVLAASQQHACDVAAADTADSQAGVFDLDHHIDPKPRSEPDQAIYSGLCTKFRRRRVMVGCQSFTTSMASKMTWVVSRSEHEQIGSGIGLHFG